MSIQIKKSFCVGCGACTEACPGNLLILKNEENSRKAYMRRPEDCWGCTACMKVCPTRALHYFLGADLGGSGSTMTIQKKKDTYIWQVKSPEGKTQEIIINRKSANQY